MRLEARKYLFDIERAGTPLIASRNVLIHGYAEIDDELVWDLLQSRLPGLLKDVSDIRRGVKA